MNPGQPGPAIEIGIEAEDRFDFHALHRGDMKCVAGCAISAAMERSGNNGAPALRGCVPPTRYMGMLESMKIMRITVRRVPEILATYKDREDLFREYPFLEEEELRQALRYGAASVDDDVHYLHEAA
jgi:hypothetical protein